MLAILCFVGLTLFAGWYAFKRYHGIFKIIRSGKSDWPADNPSQRLSRTVLFALGQKKMFKRPVAAIFHLFIYLAFILTQIELIEIIVDGITGSHRVFAAFLGGFYTVMINSIEILSLLAFIATIAFLYRRNIMQLTRLKKPEMSGWPTRDANLILLGEILLIVGIFSMNGADQVLQSRLHESYPQTGIFLVSLKLISPLLTEWSDTGLIILERFGWWLHYIVILGFVIYLSFSKHLHIFFAFPNAYFSNLAPRGRMSNMPVVQNEVSAMMQGTMTEEDPNAEMPVFGAADIFDLGKANLLQAFSCTECGRCTDVCPANRTGKRLSPRKIMMDVRDRCEELIGLNIYEQEENIEGSLFDRISQEELFACTSCQSCIEACPVLIDPMEIILEMRRYTILMNSEGPADWLPMFTSLENGGSVWQVAEERTDWIADSNG